MTEERKGRRRHKELQTATKAERGNDLYETCEVAIPPLLEAEWLPEHIWEPACGPGSRGRSRARVFSNWRAKMTPRAVLLPSPEHRSSRQYSP